MSNPDRGRCCGPSDADDRTPEGTGDQRREAVRAGYAEIAKSGQWSGVRPASALAAEDSGGSCCGPVALTAEQVARAVGYGELELGALPEGANMGLSCGNPTALAALQPGEVVLDLGSGGGLDCFVAGPKVGASGRAIGVDMTPEMLAKARAALPGYRARSGLDNVEFRLGEIEHLPAGDASVDVVLSNCVINLSPDKPQVWREIARVLRPGGRVAVSDIALLRPLPEGVRGDLEALVGCIAGAELVEDVRRAVEAAGLVDIELCPKHEYVEAMVSFDDPLYRRIAAALPEGTRVRDHVVSLEIRARRA